MKGTTRTMDSLDASEGHGERIPIVRPEGAFDDELMRELRAVLASSQLTNGSRVRAFERAAAAYLSAVDCVAVSSCTSGLMLTLRALGLRGEVILPSFTFHATAHSVLWNGLRPVFVDCDPQTFCLDPAAVEARFSAATACVLGVHLFGCPADVQQLDKVCGQRQIPVVYDAAHAFGSRIATRHVGTFGLAEVFSFSPTKLVVAGEGGLIATNDAEFARRLRAARNYGDSGNSDPDLLGLNARMSELHAALGRAGLAGLEGRIERRNDIRHRYRENLHAIPGITFQEIGEGRRSTCKDMSIIVDDGAFGATRDRLQAYLAGREIETRCYFWPPVHQQKLYREIWDGQPLPVTERVSSRILGLPIYSSLSEVNVERICDSVHSAHESAQRALATIRFGKHRNSPRVVQPSPRIEQWEETNGLGSETA